ncbi:MAG: C-GCAxxG-C-C family protein [archaeon]
MKIDEKEIEKLVNEMYGKKNCCECVLKICTEKLGLENKKEFENLAQFFGSGLNSGCVCGALIGAILISNLKNKDLSKAEAYAISNKLHQKFIARNKVACCRILKPKKRCNEIVKNMIVDLLENELL